MQTRLGAVVVGWLALGACGGPATTGNVATSRVGDPDDGLVFAWPVDAVARVTMTKDTGEGAGVSAFTLRAVANTAGERACTLTDVELLEVPGVDLHDPVVASAAAGMAAQVMAAMPSFLVDADGEFAGVGSFDAAHQRVLEASGTPQYGAIDPNQLYSDVVREYWDLWHRWWRAAARRPGAQTMQRGRYGNQVQVETIAVDAATIDVRARTTYDDAVMADVVEEMVRADGGSVRDLRVTVTLEATATLEATTGRPLVVTTSKVQTIERGADDPAPRSRETKTTWTFAWQ